MPATAGNIQQNIVAGRLQHARCFGQIGGLGETGTANIALGGAAELFPDLIFKIFGHEKLLDFCNYTTLGRALAVAALFSGRSADRAR
jgi:hypothetical protein